MCGDKHTSIMSFVVTEEARRARSLKCATYELCDGAKQEDYCSTVGTNEAEKNDKAKL